MVFRLIKRTLRAERRGWALVSFKALAVNHLALPKRRTLDYLPDGCFVRNSLWPQLRRLPAFVSSGQVPFDFVAWVIPFQKPCPKIFTFGSCVELVRGISTACFGVLLHKTFWQ